MAFNDISFLFIFFPVALILHKIMPMFGKNFILLILSLLFFAWGSPQYVVLLLLSILFNYFTGLKIQSQKEDQDQAGMKFTLITAVIVNLLLLGFFKYWGFVVTNINALLRTSIPVRQLSMPLGISFFTFSILSFLFDVYRGKATAPKNPLDFALFVSFFPKLVSGPIVQYADFAQQLHERKPNSAKSGNGCRLFLIGLAKKVLLSNIIGTTFYAISALPLSKLSVVSAWLGAICYTLMLYFDFSGYSDMAISIAQMFGFQFEKNFDYPYLSASITEFWRRWHISLGAWFRDYVYIPLGGSRVSTGKHIRNLLIVWALTGIWHGANWNFIAWGLFHGGILLIEKFLLKEVLDYIPKPIRIFSTVILAMIGWVFFFSPDLGSACVWLGRMFGIGATGFMDATAKYYLSGSWLILLIGTISAYPIGARLGSNVYRMGKGAVAVSVIWFAALLVLCIAGMLSSTYSSFLYFQF